MRQAKNTAAHGKGCEAATQAASFVTGWRCITIQNWSWESFAKPCSQASPIQTPVPINDTLTQLHKIFTSCCSIQYLCNCIVVVFSCMFLTVHWYPCKSSWLGPCCCACFRIFIIMMPIICTLGPSKPHTTVPNTSLQVHLLSHNTVQYL